MEQQVLILTRQQQLIQASLGRPLEEHVRERYVGQGWTLAEVAAELGISTSTLARWLPQLRIAPRRTGARRVA